MGLIWLAVAQNLNKHNNSNKQSLQSHSKGSGQFNTKKHPKNHIKDFTEDFANEEQDDNEIDLHIRNNIFQYPKQNEYVWYKDKLYLKEDAQRIMYQNYKQEQTERINEILNYLSKYGIDSQQMHDYLLGLDDVELDNFMEQMKQKKNDPNFLLQYRQYQRLKSIVEVIEEEDGLDEEQFDELCKISDEDEDGITVEQKLNQIHKIPYQLKQDVTTRNQMNSSENIKVFRSSTQPFLEQTESPLVKKNQITLISKSMNDIQTAQNQGQNELLKKIEKDKNDFSCKKEQFQNMYAQKQNFPQFMYYTGTIQQQQQPYSTKVI